MTKDLTCEIQQSSPWNLVDLTCEIQRISPRYHLWNPPKIIKASVSAKTLQFDECRVGISPWNLVDFTHEIWQISPRYHLWNPPKIIKASVSAKTLQFDECRVGAVTKDFMKSARFHMKSTWNPLDFKIMSFCVMIKYRSFVFQKTNQKSFCWNIWFYKVWGGFHLKSAGFHTDFMKSGGFHVKSKDLCKEL